MNNYDTLILNFLEQDTQNIWKNYSRPNIWKAGERRNWKKKKKRVKLYYKYIYYAKYTIVFLINCIRVIKEKHMYEIDNRKTKETNRELDNYWS